MQQQGADAKGDLQHQRSHHQPQRHPDRPVRGAAPGGDGKGHHQDADQVGEHPVVELYGGDILESVQAMEDELDQAVAYKEKVFTQMAVLRKCGDDIEPIEEDLQDPER